jgi:hypothetical protein
VKEALLRRPVRIVEAVVALLVAVGLLAGDPDELTTAIMLLVAALGVGGGEVAQTQTTALVDPRDNDGTPLVPGDAEHALSQAPDGGVPPVTDDPEAS